MPSQVSETPNIIDKLKMLFTTIGQLMNDNSLLKAFHEQLQDLYSVQNQSISLFSYLLNAASSIELKEAFKHHLQVIYANVKTTSQLYNQIGISCDATACEDMERLVEEAQRITIESCDPITRDVKLIIVAQEIHQYLITTLEILQQWDQVLSESTVTNLLQKFIDDEYEANHVLSKIAKTHANRRNN